MLRSADVVYRPVAEERVELPASIDASAPMLLSTEYERVEDGVQHVQRFGILAPASPPRPNDCAALREHIHAVSDGQLRLGEADDGEPCVLTTQAAAQGTCLIGAEPSIEARFVVVSNKADEYKAVITTPLATMRAALENTSPKLLEELVTPTNVKIGFDLLGAKLGVMMQLLLPTRKFHLLCALMALRMFLPLVDEESYVRGAALRDANAKQQKQQKRKRGATPCLPSPSAGAGAGAGAGADAHHESTTKDEGSVRSAFADVYWGFASFVSCHAFRLGCCTLREWKTTTDVNAINVMYSDSAGKPRMSVVALRALAADEEVKLPTPPRKMAPMHERNSTRTTPCTCKACRAVCGHAPGTALLSTQSQAELFRVFQTFALAQTLFTVPVGKALVKDRMAHIQGYLCKFLMHRGAVGLTSLLRHPEMYLAWRSIASMSKRSACVVWTREEELAFLEATKRPAAGDPPSIMVVDKHGMEATAKVCAPLPPVVEASTVACMLRTTIGADAPRSMLDCVVRGVYYCDEGQDVE